MDAPGYSIGEVSERTQLAVPVLRMWEARFGFPRPQRRPNGRRRYSESDVQRLREVVRHREAGLSLPAAIEQAQAGTVAPATVFAGLRQRRADLTPAVLSKRTMLALSHAIEDEFCARAEPAALFGSFQREEFYRRAERRWRDLARTAEVAMVFADFARKRTPRGRPAELPIDATEPVAREWAVVCDGEGYAACLAGWELPAQGRTPDMERRFEALWSIEAEVVREATGVALDMAARTAPDLADAVPPRLRRAPAPGAEDLRTLTSLTNRMLAYAESSAATASRR